MQQVIVFFQGGTTAGGIGDERVKIFGEKDVDVGSRQRSRLFREPGMKVQCAAAGLSGGDHDLAAIPLQHAHGSFVESCKRDVGNTTGQETNSIAALSQGGESLADFRIEEWRFSIGGKSLQVRQIAKELQNTSQT